MFRPEKSRNGQFSELCNFLNLEQRENLIDYRKKKIPKTGSGCKFHEQSLPKLQISDTLKNYYSRAPIKLKCFSFNTIP